MNRPARIGIGFVGGGPDSFVGRHHFLAATLDSRFTIACGVFSRSADKNAERCDELGIAEERRYAHWREMLHVESERPDGVAAIGVLTPNDGHHEIVAEALRLGFHVLCDKPVTRTLAEALELQALASHHHRILAVSYNYSGYPMVRLARQLIRLGEIGEVRRAYAQFPSGYLSRMVELEGQKQAVWRTEPERVGASAALMDLGTHAHHLVRFVTGLEFHTILASLSTAFAERRVDDNAEVLFTLSNGAPGAIWVSMIAAGLDEGPSFSVSGTDGTLSWRQKACNELRLSKPGEPVRILTKAASYTGPDRQADSRIGFGPPDGFLEAFANIYRDFADCIAGSGGVSDTLPLIGDGVAGLRFVEAGAQSSRTAQWQFI